MKIKEKEIVMELDQIMKSLREKQKSNDFFDSRWAQTGITSCAVQAA